MLLEWTQVLQDASGKNQDLLMQFRRIIRRPFRKKGYDPIVMDLIPNAKQLNTCWHSLSFLAKPKVVLTVRFYLRQLRCIWATPLAPPGPPYPQPAKCCCLQFGCIKYSGRSNICNKAIVKGNYYARSMFHGGGTDWTRQLFYINSKTPNSNPSKRTW